MEFIRNNPSLFYSFVIGLAAAILAVVVAAGVPVSTELGAAIEGLLVMVAAIAIGVATRGKTVPFKNVLEYRTIARDGTTSSEVTAGPANDRIVPGESVRGYTYEEPSNVRH